MVICKIKGMLKFVRNGQKKLGMTKIIGYQRNVEGFKINKYRERYVNIAKISIRPNYKKIDESCDCVVSNVFNRLSILTQLETRTIKKRINSPKNFNK